MKGKLRTENAERAEEAEKLRDLNGITGGIIAAAIEVHRHLGPGLLESAYQECVCYELSQMGLSFSREVHLPLSYKGLHLGCNYRIDLLVEDAIVVELKSVEQILPIHSAQLLTYLKAAHKQIGLLINFNVPVLKDGIKRIVHKYSEPNTSALSASSALSPVEEEAAESQMSSLRLSPRLCVSAVNRTSCVSAVNRKPR
jgi:GxxExxY protein